MKFSHIISLGWFCGPAQELERCGKCEAACQQHLPIRDRLAELDALAAK